MNATCASKSGQYISSNKWRVARLVLYLFLLVGFLIHAYTVILEFLTGKYVDVEFLEKLEDHGPDVALCTERPYIFHKMDLIVNYLAQKKLRQIQKHQSNYSIGLDQVKLRNSYHVFVGDVDLGSTPILALSLPLNYSFEETAFLPAKDIILRVSRL